MIDDLYATWTGRTDPHLLKVESLLRGLGIALIAGHFLLPFTPARTHLPWYRAVIAR
jgi:hypothetical protein